MKKLKTTSNGTTVFAESIIRIILVGVLAAALIYKVTALVLLCICILVLTLCAKAWAKISLNKLEQELKLSTKRAFPEDPIQVKVHVKNKKLLPVLMQFELKGEGIEPRLQEAGLLGFSDYQYEWTLTYPKRGVYSLGPLQVCAGDLLGFYSVRENNDRFWEIVIYPKLVPFSTGEIKSQEFFGSDISKNFITDPVLVAGTRDYTESHPAKHIHWMASAKTGVLQEKVLESSSHRKVVLIVDVEGFKDAAGEIEGPGGVMDEVEGPGEVMGEAEGSEEAADEFEMMLSKAATMLVELSRKGVYPSLMVNGVTMVSDNRIVSGSRNAVGGANGTSAADGDRVGISGDTGTDTVSGQLETLARLTMELDENLDRMIDVNAFRRTTSYLYFCYSVNKKVSTLKKSNQRIQFIISQEGSIAT